MIQSLPKFYGLQDDEPTDHLDEIFLHCNTMKPARAHVDDVMWRVFHLTLEGKAKQWYMSLPIYDPDALASWQNLKQAFLEKFYPATKTSARRKEINNMNQEPDESLYEYWTRFQELLKKCPHHRIPDDQLAQTFYDGLKEMDQDKLDAASGGSFIDFTPEEAWPLVKKLALAKQKHTSRRPTRILNKVETTSSHMPQFDRLEAEIKAIHSRLDRISSPPSPCSPKGNELVAPSCEICASVLHLSSNCPHKTEECNAMYQQRQGTNQRWDPYSNTYNEGWRQHPNFRWRQGDNLPRNMQGDSSQSMVPMRRDKAPSDGDDVSKSLAIGFRNMESLITSKANETRECMKSELEKVDNRMAQWEIKNANLEEYVMKLSNSFNELQARTSGPTPSNTVINPKSLNAINLRSGKTLHPIIPPKKRVQFVVDEEEGEEEPVDEEIVVEDPQAPIISPPLSPMSFDPYESAKERELFARKKYTLKEPMDAQPPTPPKGLKRVKLPSVHEKGETSNTQDTMAKPPAKEVTISQLPFPKSYFRSKKKHDENVEKEMLDLFSKLHVNVPFFQLVKSIPSYCKFLKDLCTNKRKFRPNERIQLNPSVSALFKPHFPVKCQDPGSFTVP